MRTKFLYASVVSLLLIGVVVGANASSLVNVARPGSAADPQVAPPPPLLLPPTQGEWERRDPVQAAAERKRQVAYLDGEVTTPQVTFLPGVANPAATEVSYALRSVVKYSDNNQTTVVSLAVPSGAAMKTPTLYGEKKVTLSNGEDAWLSTRDSGDLPRSLVLVRGNQIITVASTKSVEELLDVATKVKLSR